MSDTLDPAYHIKPYVHEGRGYKVLHCSICPRLSRRHVTHLNLPLHCRIEAPWNSRPPA